MLWKNVLVVSLYTVLGGIYLRKKKKEKKLLRNKRLVWLCGCQLLTCHHITTFNGKKLCGSRDIDKAILHYFMRHTCLNDCITLCVKGPYCNSPPLMTIDFMAVNLQDHVIKGSNHKPNGSKLTRPCNQGILLLYWKKLLFCVTNVPCLVTVIVVVVEI